MTEGVLRFITRPLVIWFGLTYMMIVLLILDTAGVKVALVALALPFITFVPNFLFQRLIKDKSGGDFNGGEGGEFEDG